MWVFDGNGFTMAGLLSGFGSLFVARHRIPGIKVPNYDSNRTERSRSPR
jgi:hypothetical protein